MAKYIDADLLRKEIKRRIEILENVELAWDKQGDTETSVYYSGKSVALDEFAAFIDSLQQEQPKEAAGEIGYWNQSGLSIRLDQSLERLGYDEGTKVKIIIVEQ